MAEAKGRGGQRGSRKKMRRKRNEKGEKNGRSKESSRRVGDLRQRGENGKVGGESKEVGAGKVSPMDKSLWKEKIRENANKKDVGPCDRSEERICTKKREGVPIAKRGKRGGEGVYKETAEERIHTTIKVTTDDTGILCRKEG